jgi:acyl carrier protein
MSKSIPTLRDHLSQFLLERFPQISPADLDEDKPLLTSGALDSLGVLELVAFIEENYSIELQDEDLVPDNFDRLSALVEFVEQRK